MFSETSGLYGVPIMDNQQPLMAYRKGGGIGDIYDSAERLRRKGRNGDTVLAHINPEEQDLLKSYGGSGTINPLTGLPEYGMGKFLRKAIKTIGKVAAPVAGTFLGGPLGGILASTAHGALSRSSENRLKGALQGGLTGAAYSALAPMIGNAFGANPSGMMGRAMGLNAPSFLSQLGVGSAPEMGGGLGLFGNGASNQGLISNMYNQSQVAPLAGGGAGAGSMMQNAGQGGSKGFGLSELANVGLLGTGVLGTLMGREKPGKQESVEEYLNKNRPKWGPEYHSKNFKANRKYIAPPIGYNPEIDTYHSFYDNTIPEYEEYADGGPVVRNGPILGFTDGESDDRNAKVSDGEFIFRTRAVSNLGDGNTLAGIRKLKMLQDVAMKDGQRKEPTRKKGKISIDSMLDVIRRS